MLTKRQDASIRVKRYSYFVDATGRREIRGSDVRCDSRIGPFRKRDEADLAALDLLRTEQAEVVKIMQYDHGKVVYEELDIISRDVAS